MIALCAQFCRLASLPRRRALSVAAASAASVPAATALQTPKRPITRAVIIKKPKEAVALQWMLRCADYLKRAHGIESYVEPTVASEVPSLPCVSVLETAERVDSVDGWDSGNASLTPDLNSEQFYQKLWSKLPASNGASSSAIASASPPIATAAQASFSSSSSSSSSTSASLSSSTATLPPSSQSHTWQSQIDLAIAIGGDGTLLYLSSLFPQRCPPVVSFHSGSLGFLMAFDPEDHADVFDVCLRGQQPIMPRLRLEFCVQTEEEWVRHQGPAPDARWHHLLNESVVKRSHRLTGFSEIEAYVDDDFLARFKGDGLIIASPTGSTAYSMAAGGSIVHPEIDALLLTPLNSASLASRPLLLPGSATVRLHVRTDSVYLEGRHGRFVAQGEVVILRKSKYPLPCFARDNPTADFMYDLANRLMYQRRIRGTLESARRKLVPHFNAPEHDL